MKNLVSTSLFCFIGLSAYEQVNFEPAVAYQVGIFPTELITADFNNDGHVDIACSNIGASGALVGNVAVLLGNGLGTFSAAVNFDVSANAKAIVSGDFNNDGNLDMATANSINGESTGNVSILMGDGTGGFSLNDPIEISDGVPNAIAAGKFNDDEFEDLAIGNSGHVISVLFGDGSGNFIWSANYSSEGLLRALLKGDFNNDGIWDLATSNDLTTSISVLLGESDGTFSGALNFDLGNSFAAPWGIKCRDFNGDSNLDLSVSCAGNPYSALVAGDGMGGFTSIVSIGDSYSAYDSVIEDFNLDGILDVATTHGYSTSISVCLGDDLGGFSDSYDFFAGFWNVSIVSADYNEDGRMDIAISNETYFENGSPQVVRVFLNSIPPDFVVNNDEDESIRVYPNPTHGNAKIDSDISFDNLSVEIYDNKGVLVLSQTAVRRGNILPMNTLQSGVYTAIFYQDKRNISVVEIVKN